MPNQEQAASASAPPMNPVPSTDTLQRPLQARPPLTLALGMPVPRKGL